MAGPATLFGLIAAVVTAPQQPATAQTTLTTLQPVASEGRPAIYGVAATGEAAGQERLSASRAFATFWDGTAWLNLGAPGQESGAFGIASDGTVLAGNADRRAFRFDRLGAGLAGGQFYFLPGLPGARSPVSQVGVDTLGGFVGGQPISADGSIVVGAALNGKGEWRAFRCISACGSLQELGTLQGPATGSSAALGVNADGSVVVGQSTVASGAGTARTAFYWSAATNMLDLGGLGGAGAESLAKGVSADGGVIVGQSTTARGERHAALWRRTGATSFSVQDLGASGFESIAHAVSADGSIVVGRSAAIGANGAFTGPLYWTQAGGTQNLSALLTASGVSLSGIALDSATAISPDGQLIAVNGSDASGAQAYLVRYRPAPQQPTQPTQPTTPAGTSPASPTPTAPPAIAGLTTRGAVQGSVDTLAAARLGQMAHGRVLAHVLLGGNEQVNCTPCFSAFGSIGSFSAGAHGRLPLGERLTILAGAAYGQREERGYEVKSGGAFALSARLDFADWGASRPFFEAGGYIAPHDSVRYKRRYANGAGTAAGVGATTARTGSVFARLGWVWRASPIDEIAVMADVSHTTQKIGGYAEPLNAQNPFEATVRGGSDRMNAVRLAAQWTHLFGARLEANLNAGVVRTFGSKSGLKISVFGFGTVDPKIREVTFAEVGARLGWRIRPNMIIDVFANAQLGPRPIGTGVHGGLAYRHNF
ncbi:MAG: hypothetical protein JNK46_19110 [Methylobacteriaceae bacterium]|nr:hypothetical protein [Methylobacteriaceae bacterium]